MSAPSGATCTASSTYGGSTASTMAYFGEFLKSPLSKTDGIISKFSAVSLPTFNCVFTDSSATGGFTTAGNTPVVIKPYSCSPTTSGMDATTGVFTVATAGQYRLTFMSRMKRTEKKVVAEMYNGGTVIGRSTAQVMQNSECKSLVLGFSLVASGHSVPRSTAA